MQQRTSAPDRRYKGQHCTIDASMHFTLKIHPKVVLQSPLRCTKNDGFLIRRNWRAVLAFYAGMIVKTE